MMLSMKITYISLALLLISGCSLISEQAQDQRRQDIEEIAAEIESPSVERSLLESAKDAENSGNFGKAEQFYKQLIDRNPNKFEYKFHHAEISRKAGKCDAAISRYDSLLQAQPNNIDVMEGKGLCLLATGKNSKASEVFSKILAAEPNRWKSLNAAGLIFATDKKFNEANQYFDAAVAASNNEPAVLNNQALTKALMGNFKDASKILDKAASESKAGSPQRRSIDLNRALIYGISGNLDSAEKAARPHLTEAQLFNNMGVYAELAKDKELAKTYLNKAMQETPVYYDRAWENLQRIKSGK